MCTAYEIGKKGNRLPARVKPKAADKLRAQAETRIIRPTLSAPVIMPNGELREMSWGFRRSFKGKSGKPIGRTIVNSREDKLSGMTWRDAFRHRRCLILASSFFEWVEGPGGRAKPLRFTSVADDWLWIAGIWEEGEKGECFSMITTEPTAAIAPVHDRMPAVLAPEQIDRFLDADLHEFGPSSVPLEFAEAVNFLQKPNKSAPPDSQGSLF